MDRYKSCKSGGKSEEFFLIIGTEGVDSDTHGKRVLNLEHLRGAVGPSETCWLGAVVVFDFLSLPISDSVLKQVAKKFLLFL